MQHNKEHPVLSAADIELARSFQQQQQQQIPQLDNSSSILFEKEEKNENKVVKWRIRYARESDLETILEIMNDAILNTTFSYRYDPESLSERQAWFRDHQTKYYPVLVLVREDETPGETVMGFCSLNEWNWKQGYRFTTDCSIYLKNATHRQGFGRQMLSELLKEGKRRGFRSVIATITADNLPSIQFFMTMGFRQVGRFENIGYKFGQWLDVVYLEICLW